MTQLAYPPNDQEDEILLMLDNTKITLETLVNMCREFTDMDTNDLAKRMRAYVRSIAPLDMKRVGDHAQAECLRGAVQEMQKLMGDRYPQYWWRLCEHYRQKYQESL